MLIVVHWCCRRRGRPSCTTLFLALSLFICLVLACNANNMTIRVLSHLSILPIPFRSFYSFGFCKETEKTTNSTKANGQTSILFAAVVHTVDSNAIAAATSNSHQTMSICFRCHIMLIIYTTHTRLFASTKVKTNYDDEWDMFTLGCWRFLLLAKIIWYFHPLIWNIW